MSVLVSGTTTVICQGAGGAARSLLQSGLDYGTKFVGVVASGKGGSTLLGVPCFNTVEEAVVETSATASMICVPPQQLSVAANRAVDAKVDLIVCTTDGVPEQAMIELRDRLSRPENDHIHFLGPNSIGIASPGDRCVIGRIPPQLLSVGREGRRIGIISGLRTVCYEALKQLLEEGLGVSTCIGGEDSKIYGRGLAEVVRMFLEDSSTDGILIIGDLGGNEEEYAAELLKNHPIKKPTTAFIAGLTASDRYHVSKENTNNKISFLKSCGIQVSPTSAHIGKTITAALENAS